MLLEVLLYLDNNMKKLLIFVSFLIFSINADDPGSIKVAGPNVQTRAPAGNVNCDCQCESPAYLWTANNGIVAGDCKA